MPIDYNLNTPKARNIFLYSVLTRKLHASSMNTESF